MDKVIEYWPLIVFGLGGFGWLIRLEAKVMYMASDQARVEKTNAESVGRLEKEATEREKTVWTKMDAMKDSLTAIRESLAKIEGKLEVDR